MSVNYNNETKTFTLKGKNLCYSFWINDLGYPEHLYFGAPVGSDDLRYTRAFGATSMAATPQGIDNVPSYNAYPSELSFSARETTASPRYRLSVTKRTSDGL